MQLLHKLIISYHNLVCITSQLFQPYGVYEYACRKSFWRDLSALLPSFSSTDNSVQWFFCFLCAHKHRGLSSPAVKHSHAYKTVDLHTHAHTHSPNKHTQRCTGMLWLGVLVVSAGNMSQVVWLHCFLRVLGHLSSHPLLPSPLLTPSISL